MSQSGEHFSLQHLASDDSIDTLWRSGNLTWHVEYEKMGDYWLRHIIEGIYLAAKIKIVANLSKEERKTV